MVARQLPPELVHERSLVRLQRRQRQADDEARDVVGPVARDRQQEQRQRRPRLVVEPVEQAEIEQREPAVLGQQHVARMRIGVVDAVDRHLPDVGAEEVAREPASLVLREPVSPADLLAVDPLEDEDALRDVRPDHLRDEERRKVGDRGADELGVVRLSGQVELPAQVHLEFAGQRLELEELRLLGVAVQEPDRGAHQVEIDVDLLHHPRPPHLDHDLAPVLEERAVDLGDRGARQRLCVDAREDIRTEIGDDRLLDLLERDGRRVVDELRELVDVDVGKQVRPR